MFVVCRGVPGETDLIFLTDRVLEMTADTSAGRPTIADPTPDQIAAPTSGCYGAAMSFDDFASLNTADIGNGRDGLCQ